MIHSIGWPSRPQSWPMNEQSAASHPAPGVCKNVTNWNCHDVSRPGSWFHTPARSLGDFLDMTNILGRPSENVLVTAICRGFQGKLAFASSRRQRPNEPKGRRIYNPEFNHPPSPFITPHHPSSPHYMSCSLFAQIFPRCSFPDCSSNEEAKQCLDTSSFEKGKRDSFEKGK